MFELAAKTNQERQVYFDQASQESGLGVAMVEKDFWVTLILRILFSKAPMHEWFTFKGGTSLSKVYKLIDRFSEDIDLSIDRKHLGFEGFNDPKQAGSRSKRETALEELNRVCAKRIQEVIQPTLKTELDRTLGAQKRWQLRLDSKDSMTLLFEFPTTGKGWRRTSFQPAVRIEFGARAETWPSQIAEVESYLSKALQKGVKDAVAKVTVLKAERTFWEKATILHSIFYGGQKRLRPDQSRHYYDLYMLAKSSYGKSAVKQIELLAAVAQHKNLFYHAAWAEYDEAKVGTLRLAPNKELLEKLEDDYEKMGDMFFGSRPTFTEIANGLESLEKQINST